MKIRKGDTVQLISGSRDDRGKQGKVIAVYLDTQRVLVEGINRIKKHTKMGTTGRGARTGGIITQEAPVHVSNVMLVDPESKRPTRTGSRVETVERGDRDKRVRVRVAKRSGKDI
ncbi:MAG: 50S ribosomal protein L24 [Actinomycetales bacterium]|nr:50S ribosomal protein L24 [Actinomycetales bacterium]